MSSVVWPSRSGRGAAAPEVPFPRLDPERAALRVSGSRPDGGGAGPDARSPFFFSHRVSVLLLTFLTYTLYHASRKPLSVVKNELINCTDTCRSWISTYYTASTPDTRHPTPRSWRQRKASRTLPFSRTVQHGPAERAAHRGHLGLDLLDFLLRGHVFEVGLFGARQDVRWTFWRFVERLLPFQRDGGRAGEPSALSFLRHGPFRTLHGALRTGEGVRLARHRLLRRHPGTWHDGTGCGPLKQASLLPAVLGHPPNDGLAERRHPGGQLVRPRKEGAPVRHLGLALFRRQHIGQRDRRSALLRSPRRAPPSRTLSFLPLSGHFVSEDWAYSFIVPGALLAGFGVVVWLFAVDKPQSVGLRLEEVGDSLRCIFSTSECASSRRTPEPPRPTTGGLPSASSPPSGFRQVKLSRPADPAVEPSPCPFFHRVWSNFPRPSFLSNSSDTHFSFGFPRSSRVPVPRCLVAPFPRSRPLPRAKRTLRLFFQASTSPRPARRSCPSRSTSGASSGARWPAWSRTAAERAPPPASSWFSWPSQWYGSGGPAPDRVVLSGDSDRGPVFF